ncbi:hypothetical protein [Flagellimonas oceanensis]|uniref:hypothetical protein n=1 Tax=Flagellimonas oceanensis TaxID=2499163 RepID=UPI000F8E887D|nr:hypothetical protein [Allomuricauda oceanensis]
MSKYSAFIILILLVGCQETSQSQEALGTWNYCTRDGNYEEWIITRDFLLIMSTKPKKFFLFQNEIKDGSLVISTIKGEINLPMPKDTLIILVESKKKMILKSVFESEPLQLNRVEYDFEPVDWENLEYWKSKVHSEFEKRAALEKCPDLRSDEEKIIPEIILDSRNILGEEVPMTPIQKSKNH